MVSLEITDRIRREEIEKWINKLEEELSSVVVEEDGKVLLENARSYLTDSKHFIEKGNYVLAWEAISFAWGVFEAGVWLGLFKKK